MKNKRGRNNQLTRSYEYGGGGGLCRRIQETAKFGRNISTKSNLDLHKLSNEYSIKEDLRTSTDSSLIQNEISLINKRLQDNIIFA